MGDSTFTASLSGNSALIMNGKNAYQPYLEKDTLWFSDRLVVADGDIAADGNCSIILEGVTEVEAFNLVEDRNGTFVAIIPTSITYSTTAGAVKATMLVAINASTTALHFFAICKV